MTTATCPKCPEVQIKVENLQNSLYFGPTISCAKCDSIILSSQNYFQSFAVMGPNYTAAQGAAIVPSSVLNLHNAPYSMSGSVKWDVSDAEHVTTCQCKECKCKVNDAEI